MAKLRFKNPSCFGLGRIFCHFSAETDILPKPLFLAEYRRNRVFGRTLVTTQKLPQFTKRTIKL